MRVGGTYDATTARGLRSRRSSSDRYGRRDAGRVSRYPDTGTVRLPTERRGVTAVTGGRMEMCTRAFPSASIFAGIVGIFLFFLDILFT